jgi:hypothetical protein
MLFYCSALSLSRRPLNLAANTPVARASSASPSPCPLRMVPCGPEVSIERESLPCQASVCPHETPLRPRLSLVEGFTMVGLATATVTGLWENSYPRLVG